MSNIIIQRKVNGKVIPEYKAWDHMKQRCYNPNYVKSKNYLGRGITVCERWRNSFKNFYEDMGKRPDGMSLDRIDNNGNYEPGNCRWIDIYTQNNNMRSNNGSSLVKRTFVYVGVYMNPSGNYSTSISLHSSYKYIGTYETLEEAISAKLFAESLKAIHAL